MHPETVRNRILPWISLCFFLGALWILHHLLAEHRIHDILRSLHSIPSARIIQALLLTIFSYAFMIFYDRLALAYIHQPLAWRRSALASLVSYAFSNNIGLSIFTSGTLRYRFYTAWNLSGEDIGRLIAFTTGTFLLGILTVGGFLFALDPVIIPDATFLPLHTTRPIGILFIGAATGYLLLLKLRHRTFHFRDWELPAPTVKTGFLQLLTGSVDWLLAAAVLFILLPEGTGISYPHFLTIFLFAQIAGLISNVPGGLGVFETVILLFIPEISTPILLGILLAYRGIYYLLPFGAAVLLLGIHELRQQRSGLSRAARKIADWSAPLVPSIMALATLMAGSILLFSGALPSAPGRLNLIKQIFPLELVEVSHFLGSIIGAALLLVARGLQRRVDGAWMLSIILLASGVLVSLLKGADYDEALLLSLPLIALIPTRRQFYRRSSLIGEAFSPGWVAAIVLILLSSIWLGLFSYKHVDYTAELWWKFAFHGDAPRFLRASLGATALLFIFALARLLGPPKKRSAQPAPEDLLLAARIVASSSQSEANLALLGDKAFLFDREKKGFIMYAAEKQTWVSMGDPVGPDEVRSELVWNFRELVERNSGWPVFYEVDTSCLHLYLDIGLTLLKIGEAATVPLTDFSLEGPARKNLRYTYRKLSREGLVFEVVPRDEVPAFIPSLRHISDVWLEEKKGREKKFSLGFFDEAYLSNFPVALVRWQGEVIAFANLWTTAGREELSIDLMRYLPDSVSGVMDFLFINLMLWGKEQGYRQFAMGMAPLSGLENRPFAPLWNRVGSVMFRHGEHFYNFEGLRSYKAKFAPVWEPRYLACPGGMSLPKILLDISALIGGNLKNLFSRA